MARYFGAMAVMAAVLVIAACGGGSNDDADTGDAGSQVSTERIHSRYLISEFERDGSGAAKEYGDKYITFEAFVDQHGTNSIGTHVRLKSEPFATRFIYCYYDPALQLDIPKMEFGSVVFVTGRVGEFEDIFLQVFDCSPATVDTAGGGTLSGGTHLNDQ